MAIVGVDVPEPLEALLTVTVTDELAVLPPVS
jgi:hypothetical protein